MLHGKCHNQIFCCFKHVDPPKAYSDWKTNMKNSVSPAGVNDDDFVDPAAWARHFKGDFVNMDLAWEERNLTAARRMHADKVMTGSINMRKNVKFSQLMPKPRMVLGKFWTVCRCTRASLGPGKETVVSRVVSFAETGDGGSPSSAAGRSDDGSPGLTMSSRKELLELGQELSLIHI